MSDKTKQEETTGVFPLRWPVSFRQNRNPRVVEISEDGATEVFGTLTSETARELLSQLHTEPQTASDLAEAVDTSVQNIQYHLQKFDDAGLVEIVDHWYSSRGTEMNVYGPSDSALVLYAGNELEKHSLRKGLTQILGAISVLGVLSVLFDYIVRSLVDAPGAAPVTDPSEPSSPMNPIGPVLFGFSIPPAVMFFLGGLSILVLGVIWWYRVR